MNCKQWLGLTIQQFESAGIGTARLDAEVLLADCLGKDRSWVLAHPEYELTPVQLRDLTRQATQRSSHMPLAYVRRKTEFFGREFIVNTRVLEPRPESETMIELLKQLPLPPHPRLADIGSGSGALGITAALELPGATVLLYDIDPETLVIAKQNARRYKLRPQMYQADLLSDPHGPYDALLCNLPYVPDTHTINEAAANEPRIAIFGGADGLDLYRRLFRQCAGYNWPDCFVLTESLPMQHAKLINLAKRHGFKQYLSEDFIVVFKRS